MDILKYSKDFPSLLYLVRNNPYPVYPEYSTFLSRLKTYESYPSTLCKDKYALSECGFKYTGTEDMVQCFFCGLVLKNWMKGSGDPWLEHSKSNPNCLFVLLYKGNQFIENVRNSHCNNCKSEISYDVVG